MSKLRLPKLNSVILVGRLTREIELRYTASGTAVAKLSLAFDRSYKKGDEWVKEPSFIDVTVWDKLAEKSAELSKGDPVLVEGYLKTNQYQDKNGNNRKSTEIVAFKAQPLAWSDDLVTDDKQPYQEIKDDDVPF